MVRSIDRDDDLRSLVFAIWPGLKETASSYEDKEYRDIYKYFRHELNTARKLAPKEGPAISTADVLAGVQTVVNHTNETKRDLMRRFGALTSGTLSRNVEAAVRALELCSRLSTTCAIGDDESFDHTPFITSTAAWKEDAALGTAMSTQFQRNDGDARLSQGLRLDRAMTAASLVRMCDLQIVWTSNLLDHLLLDRSSRTLKIYEHKICIINHIRYGVAPSNKKNLDKKVTELEAQVSPKKHPLFPPSLLEETLDTLNLLFPFMERPTKRLLKREQKSFGSLGQYHRDLVYELSHYSYWRPRLLELVAFFESPPRSSWWQVLVDRRDKVQWTTYWIAVVILVLTVVSIVFGIASTVYAYKQYALALAQACSQPGACAHLPKFCPCA